MKATKGILPLAAGFMLLCSSAHSDVLPFFDDFDGDVTQIGRDPVQWIPGLGNVPGSTLSSTAGDLILANDGGLAGAFVFEASPQNPNAMEVADVSLTTQLRFLQNGTGTSFAALGARGDADELYWGGIDSNSGQFLIGSTDTANGTVTRGSQSTPLNPMNEDVILQLDVTGTSVEFSAFEVGNPSPVASLAFTDTALIDGGIGVFINGGTGNTREVAFRYFDAVPEPSSMFTIGIACFVFATRRRPR